MTWKLGIGVLAVAGVLACSKGNGGLSVRATATEPGTGGGDAAGLTIDNGVVLERVRLAVREVEVEPASCPSGDDGSGDESGSTAGTLAPMHDGDDDGIDDDGDDCDLEFGPFLVDLSADALAGGIHYVFDVPVPAGTYRELEFKVNTISATKAGGDAGLLEMANEHASIIVDGRLPSGEAFSFAVPFEVEQAREGAIVVDPDAGAGVTLEIDPTHWFSGPDGGLLVPNDPLNEGEIRANIRASIRLHHDDDGDGCDDDVDPSCDDHSGDD